MKIVFAKRMTKQYEKLSEREREHVDEAIALFRKNPFAAALRNHPLKGTQKNRRALSAGFDLRIIFEEHDKYMLVIMLAVGTHEEVY